MTKNNKLVDMTGNEIRVYQYLKYGIKNRVTRDFQFLKRVFLTEKLGGLYIAYAIRDTLSVAQLKGPEDIGFVMMQIF